MDLISADFEDIFLGYFTGTRTIMQISLCHWSNASKQGPSDWPGLAGWWDKKILYHCLTHCPLGDLVVILKHLIFNLAFLIGIFKSSYDNILRWMPQGLTDDKSTLVQVMAWCRQATIHYLNQCWPRSPTPYGATRPRWVKSSPLISP